MFADCQMTEELITVNETKRDPQVRFNQFIPQFVNPINSDLGDEKL